MAAKRVAARFGVELKDIIGLCGVEIVLRGKAVLGEFERLEALCAQFADLIMQRFVLGDVFGNHALTRGKDDRVEVGHSGHGLEELFGRFLPVFAQLGLKHLLEAAGFEIGCAQLSGRIHGKGNGFGVVHGTAFCVNGLVSSVTTV